MENVSGIVVPGYLANGIHVGIKNDGKKDLALIFSSKPAKAVGVFTTNSFKAAPVVIDMERIKKGIAQAILINSGNANAATGEEGYRSALAMSRAASEALGIRDELMLIASTGIIGQPLPLRNIAAGMKDIVSGLHSKGIVNAQEAIMTTDKFKKISLRKKVFDGKEITLCGIAKGAGMISPNMATMLAFFITDAHIGDQALKSAFHQSINKSFNAINVDGCMSTNDTAIILANDVAKNKMIGIGTKGYLQFKEMLLSVMLELSKEIVRDGEGATKVIEVIVKGARTLSDARKVGYAVANSSLVKTAFFGCDPNWGRIISAIGSTKVPLFVDSVKVYYEDILVFSDGLGVKVNTKELTDIMARPYIKLVIEMSNGNKCFSLLTSDLSYDYVKINAHYHT